MDTELKKIIDETLQEYFSSDPSIIGIDSGEKKYSKQEPGGQMAAVNCDESAFRVYNETLCPELWDEQLHLDPEVRLNLLHMARDFYEKTKFTAPILDVYLMGSIANYNWTPDSDADVHVIIDFTQLQMPDETASKVAKSAGAQWNLEHNANVKGHKVEINIQSVKAEKPHVTGIYSLMKDVWIRKPVKMNVQVNKLLIQVQYREIKKFVEAAIQSRDRERMKTAKDYLDDYRQHGLDTAGELSTQNIVYKIIRTKGLIKALKDKIVAMYDKQMSVDEGHDPDYDSSSDFLERRDRQMCEIAHFLKENPVDKNVPWITISATLLKKTWLIFGKYNRVNVNDIDKIADRILSNIARLYVSNEFTGHSRNHHMKEEVAENCDIEFTQEEWDDNSWRFENISDYGMEPLEKIYGQIFNAETPEEKFYACDRALNVVHQRSDLAKIFVQGGTTTLTAIANQGGYNAGYSYGDVNKIMQSMNEGYGAGIPEKDRLHITGRRWQIRSKDAPKTPKMSLEDEAILEDVIEELLLETPELKTLKKNRRTLTDDERSIVMGADAVWHMGKDGGTSPAVWKAVVNGKTWFVTNTHRLYQVRSTLKAAITAYHKHVKQSA